MKNTVPKPTWGDRLSQISHSESAAGVLLMIATVIALVLMNSPLASAVKDFWHFEGSITVGPWTASMSLLHLVNDGLMTIFFFLVGLEIKAEIVRGELQKIRDALLPIAGAIGGMIAPALIYLIVLPADAVNARSGWGIPMATDIAFVVGFLSLLGSRVPRTLKLFILTLAIVDDIGAVLVIALFYTSEIYLPALGFAALLFGVIAFAQKKDINSIAFYTALGLLIWLCFLKAGVHPTVAGVLLGLLTPAVAPSHAFGHLRTAMQDIKSAIVREDQIQRVWEAGRDALPPLDRLESSIHPWVNFMIMPIFALANAGIVLRSEVLLAPVATAVSAGLLLGKPIGIMLATFIVIKLGWTSLPRGVKWPGMFGASILCGIGFTMSIFVAGLALPPEILDAGKMGTLFASACAALLGLLVLLWALRAKTAATS